MGQNGVNWEQDYLDLITTHLDAGLHILDFISDPESARATINAWIEERTETRIKDLLPPNSINSLTRSVLTNAVYFKAPWAASFEENLTRDGDFRLEDGSTVQVPLMRNAEYFKHTVSDELLALEIPFRGGKLAMTFVLPKTQSIAEFEASLDADKWLQIVNGLNNDNVQAVVPKFTFETTAQLRNPLTAMGLEKIFSSPDFSGMTREIALVVSDVYHKTFVALDEGGAEAAAATAIVLDRESADPTPSAVVAFDQPFIFAIRDRDTGLILFLGRVMDPRTNAE